MDKDGCKVSVVCTAYQHAPYIREALEGFVTQETDFAFEVLVSDDASSDGTAELIREYAERYPQIIRPFCLEQNRYSQGINLYDTVLYPAARGRYIAACEGDDCWTDPHKLQRQADFLDSHPDYVACVHNTLAHFVDGSAPDKLLFPRTGDRDLDLFTVLPGMSHAYHTSSLMARRELLLDPPDYRQTAFRHGFTDFAVACHLTRSGKVRFLDETMSLYRIGSNASAWSSGVDGDYEKLKRFITGELLMLRQLRDRCEGAEAEAVDRAILTREYELLEIRGDAAAQRQGPYREIYRQKPLDYKLKHLIKRRLPGLHRLYRRRRGYGD